MPFLIYPTLQLVGHEVTALEFFRPTEFVTQKWQFVKNRHLFSKKILRFC